MHVILQFSPKTITNLGPAGQPFVVHGSTGYLLRHESDGAARQNGPNMSGVLGCRHQVCSQSKRYTTATMHRKGIHQLSDVL